VLDEDDTASTPLIITEPIRYIHWHGINKMA